MKTQTNLLLITIVLSLIHLSCKKNDSSSVSSNSITVNYQATWSSALLSTAPNQIAYTNSTGNGQIDANITGLSWTKTVVIQKPTNSLILSIGAFIYSQTQGTCDVKIYVNGVLKSENMGSGNFTGNNYAFGINAVYNY